MWTKLFAYCHRQALNIIYRLIKASCNKGAFIMPKIKIERNIYDKLRKIEVRISPQGLLQIPAHPTTHSAKN